MLAFSAPGLIGKLPKHGDFIRVRAAEPVARSFEQWLEEGYEAARLGGPIVGPEPVRFLLKPNGIPSVLLGVLTASADKVGRRFPLAVFTQTSAAALCATYPVVPAAARAFLDAATALLAEASRLAPAEIPALLDSLPLPTGESFERELAAARGRAGRDLGRDLLARLFGGLGRGQRHYALHCFRTACAPVRRRAPVRASVVLDCPVHEDIDRWTWLELARRELRWSVPASFAWREDEVPRFLLSIGSFPAVVFALLCDGERKDVRLWPLTTAHPAAVAAADKALGPAVVAALDGSDKTLLDLLAAVSS